MTRHAIATAIASLALAMTACGTAGSPGRPAARPARLDDAPQPAVAANARVPRYFPTVPPGAALPSGAQCARWVRARPSRENKRVNRRFNHATGQHVGRHFFAGDAPQAERLLAPRINGKFTGTTQEILRWAACKWGINQDIVFAQAAVESWWRQTTKGDWEAGGCPPGHGPGVDGRPGLCPQSWESCRTGTPTRNQAGRGSRRPPR